jgi:outer membrane protein TolC
MLFKRVAFNALVGLFITSTAAAQSAPTPDHYWDFMAQAVTGHPAYTVFMASKDSAGSLLAIEQARRYPKIEGLFSREDGASTLTNTPSAWQTGLALTYPLFDNQRQGARDQIAIAQGHQELYASAQSVERLLVDLANAHIRMWEAGQTLQILHSASRHIAGLQARVAQQVKTGEASVLLQSKFTKMGLDIKTKILIAQQRLESAVKTWMLTGVKPGQEVLLPKVSSGVGLRYSHTNLRRIRAELARAQSELDFAKRDEGMAVNLQASILVRKFSSQSGWPRYQTWRVNATYPFFDGGLAGSRTQREALKLATKQAELEAEQAQTDIEIDRIQSLLASMQTVVASIEEQCLLQSKIADNMLVRFDLGRGNLTEVTEAYLASNECSLTVVRNRADYFTRYHDLSRLNGTLANLIIGTKQ